jgi:hypothetical protein
VKKAIELADTTFRAYKKKNGATALHLRTHLIVYADAVFRAQIWKAQPALKLDEPEKPIGLYAFMKGFPRCWLQLPDRKQCECNVGYSPFPEARSIKRPAGGPWVTFDRKDITDEECVLCYFSGYMVFRDVDIFGEGNFRGLSIADMKLVFHINFPGRSPGKIVFRRKVPIVRRGHGW